MEINSNNNNNNNNNNNSNDNNNNNNNNSNNKKVLIVKVIFTWKKGKKAYQCSGDFFSLPLDGPGWNEAKNWRHSPFYVGVS